MRLVYVSVGATLNMTAQGRRAAVAHLTRCLPDSPRPGVSGEIPLEVLLQDGLNGDGHRAIAPNVHSVYKCIAVKSPPHPLPEYFETARGRDSAPGMRKNGSGAGT